MFERAAKERKCGFLDAGNVIQSSDIDGIHLEKAEHRKLGETVAQKVKELFSVPHYSERL